MTAPAGSIARPDGGAPNRLRKELGLWDVYAISTGAMFSSGFFLLPGLAAAQTGPSVALAYVVAGLLIVPAMFCVAELATLGCRGSGEPRYPVQQHGAIEQPVQRPGRAREQARALLEVDVDRAEEDAVDADVLLVGTDGGVRGDQRYLVPELLQSAARPDRLGAAVLSLLESGARRGALLEQIRLRRCRPWRPVARRWTSTRPASSSRRLRCRRRRPAPPAGAYWSA